MKEVILDALIDSIKLLPFLFIVYLIMEFLEHKSNSKTEKIIKKSGKFGPVVGTNDVSVRTNKQIDTKINQKIKSG